MVAVGTASLLRTHWSHVMFLQVSGLSDHLCASSRVERRWRLWQEFMNEQAHLDAWLRSTEQSVAALSSAHFTHGSAKEELWKLEVRTAV